LLALAGRSIDRLVPESRALQMARDTQESLSFLTRAQGLQPDTARRTIVLLGVMIKNPPKYAVCEAHPALKGQGTTAEAVESVALICCL
jgi:hypothetical protein